MKKSRSIPWQNLFSIANQIRYGLIVIVLSSLSITSSFLIYSSFRNRVQESYLKQQYRAQIASTQIDAYIDDLQRKLGYLARVRGLADLPKNTQYLLLEGLIRHNSAYQMITIVDSQGNPVVTTSSLLPFNMGNWAKTKVFLQAFGQQEEYVDSVESNQKTGELFTNIAVPIRNNQDQVSGIIVAKINLKYLDFIVSQTDVGKTGYIYIVDERNFLIAQKDYLSHYLDLQNLSNLDFLKKLTDNNQQNMTVYKGLKGVEVVGAIAPLSRTKWSVIVEVPTTEVYAPVLSVIKTMVLILIVAVIITILIGFIVSNKIIYPLQKLTQAAAKLGAGDFNTQVEINNQNNELGVLATTFNKMSTQIKDFYQSLEQKVNERTHELLKVNGELEKEIIERKQAESDLQEALLNLQNTQLQLIQAEKMSSLGQLVAGIAHEINNPVGFIHGNLDHATTYTEDILRVLNLYQKYYPNPPEEIQTELELVDIDFIFTDLPELVNSMKIGTNRIREIVLSLRNFSRLDEADMKAVDIHDGIESTLFILQNRLKATGDLTEIKVVKDYGNLPLVECYAGQLNQVFMNIIANGIDAFSDTRHQKLNKEKTSHICQITISTDTDESGFVIINIADNGPGIPDKIKKQIFDPFFTTKPVGKGTGLGLSISYQIVVERHKGFLSCISEVGKGTEFIIKIPIYGYRSDFSKPNN